MRTLTRHGLTATASVCVAVALFSLAAYLTLDPESSRVDIRQDTTSHYPLLLVHIATSVLALCLGTLQLMPALRRRRRVHRTVGRIYLFAGVFPGAVSGFCVAVLTTYGPTAQFGFGMLSVLWFVTAVQGLRAARARRVAEHREWMIRQYALLLAAVTLRVLLPLLLVLYSPQLDTVYGGDQETFFREVYQVVPWLCWVPNLVIAEWFLRRHGASTRDSSHTPLEQIR
ncbi:DUF2306 domain-containing protein [Nocardiopsis halotolerans]|uniref:DUF2306 domain-containing protein n=1 Tax=Nocardiopsis halotolerans TaxID=124252 RepID=UPI00034922A3|nr:DUF2306 domain-containing protein [Nocardiopsis halotolerans]